MRSSWWRSSLCCFVFFSGSVTRHAMASSARRPSANDFVVRGLTEVEPAFKSFDGDMFAGVLPTVPFENQKEDHDDGHLMFWYFDSNKPVVDDSILIWFNGGPGCSSFDAGLLFEFGPAVTPSRPAGYFGGSSERHAPLGANPYAWTKATDVIFIEQPVGVGFSFGGSEPQDESDVASDFIGFLQNFYDTFPSTRSKRLFLVGESYAGMYIPAIAHHIYERNQRMVSSNHQHAEESNKHIPLSGIALGNAWIDASTQGGSVINYAYWHGLIDSVARDYFQEAWKRCYVSGSSWDRNFDRRQPKPFHSFTTPDECGIMESLMAAAGAGIFSWGAPSIYDVSTWDPYDLIISSNSTIEGFFNNPRVRDALNVPKEHGPWSGCIPGAGRRKLATDNDKTAPHGHRGRRLHLLDFDVPVSMAPYIAQLLDDAKIPVLVYNGDRDLSTNAQGSEMVLDGMKWSGQQDWQNPHVYKRGVWMVNGYPAGYSKTVQNLDFVVVYNSGHLVPMNVPVAALDMITRFLKGDSLIDHKIPLVYESTRNFSTRNDSGWNAWHVAVAFVAGILATHFVYRTMYGRKRNDYDPIVEATAP